MSNAIDPRDAYFAAKGITDPDAIAYLKRYPEVGAAVEQYGPDTAQIHYATWGKDAGWKWGRDADPAPAPAAASPATPPPPSMYGNGAENWDSFRKQAQAATQGTNQMPFVFSDYGAIPADNKAANALFFSAPAIAPAINPLMTTPAVTVQNGVVPNPLFTGYPPNNE